MLGSQVYWHPFVRCFFSVCFCCEVKGIQYDPWIHHVFCGLSGTLVKMRIYVTDVGTLFLQIYMYMMRKYYVLCLRVVQQSFHEV